MRTLQFLDFHKHHLNNRTFDSCVWVNKEEGIFKVKWLKAPKNLKPSELGIMFEWWKLKYGNTGIGPNEPSLIKNNYRSSQNSKIKEGKLIRRKDLEPKDSMEGAWRVLQFPKSQENVSFPNNDIGEDISMTDPGDLIARFDPGEMFADTFIDEEFSEVRHGNKKWEIVIKAYSKGTVIWDYTYDFAAEGLGSKKLLVYVDGNRTKYFDQKHLGRLIPESDYKSLNTAYPINPNIHRIFSQEFSHPRNPEKTMTRKDTFCPGFILEVDNCFNVYVTRLSLARLYYGHHGVQNNWQKLEMLKDGKRYLTSMESQDGVKQMIFSYRKFIHYSGVYQKWLDHGKPEISLIDSKVLMPVDDVPDVGKGCALGSQFYFEVDHKPATKIRQWIKQQEDNKPVSIFTSDPSDDPFLTERFSQLNLSQQVHGAYSGYSGQYNGQHGGQHGGQYGSSNGQFVADSSQYSPGSTQYGASSGQYSPGSTQFGASSGQYSPGSTQYGAGGSSQYSPGSSQNGTGNSHNGASSSQYGTSSSQFGAGNNEYSSGISQFSANSGQYYGESGRFENGSYQNVTGCIQYGVRCSQHGTGNCQCAASINQNGANSTQYSMNNGQYVSSSTQFNVERDEQISRSLIFEPAFPDLLSIDLETPPTTCRESFRLGNMTESNFNNGICALCESVMCTCCC